eukprot:g57145.t1
MACLPTTELRQTYAQTAGQAVVLHGASATDVFVLGWKASGVTPGVLVFYSRHRKKLEMLTERYDSVKDRPTAPIGDYHNAPVWEDYLNYIEGPPEINCVRTRYRVVRTRKYYSVRTSYRALNSVSCHEKRIHKNLRTSYMQCKKPQPGKMELAF